MRAVMRSPAPALEGTVLAGGIRVVQLLGSGGTGHVYAAVVNVWGSARQAALPPKPPLHCILPEGERVAVKVLRPELEGRPELRARFEREASAAASLCHPNILRVYEIGQLPDGLPYFTMELLLGLDLADTLAGAGALGRARAVAIADGLAAALEASHAAGIIHRDVRPENVFLVHADDGREIVKLLDFGLAWGVWGSNAPIPRGLGSPEYTAPEERAGAPASPAADIYSLGVVLHEMLTGQLPGSPSNPSVMRRVTPEWAVPPDLAGSAALAAIVGKALASDPADRFASMSDLRRALAARL